MERSHPDYYDSVELGPGLAPEYMCKRCLIYVKQTKSSCLVMRKDVLTHNICNNNNNNNNKQTNNQNVFGSFFTEIVDFMRERAREGEQETAMVSIASA